jgi:transcriptional regulator with AAA-type ATPase domain
MPEPATVVPTVRRIYEQAARVAAGDVSVLIQGESGTGKEVLARYLHAASPRHAGPFVALNCAALPRDLLEAELFGIEEKVATGVAPRPGKFELADGGTLFLDEIGDMAPETQARILRVLQEGEVFRIGASRPRPANVRTLAATNRDLDRMLAEGGFRGDLYHRIADWRVTLPPLRARRADLANLAAHFLASEAERRGLRVAGISRAALDTLCAHDWPGNIRQLQREMARAALFLDAGAVLESRHLDETLRRAGGSKPGTAGGTLKERLTEAERREICRALEETGDDVSAAARLLAVGRSTLYRRMAGSASSPRQPNRPRADRPDLEDHTMTNLTRAACLTSALLAFPALVQAQGRGPQGVPPGHMPPAGQCRIWHDNLPPGHQPAPTDCARAQREASRTGGRVVYGGDNRNDRGDDRRNYDRSRIDYRDRAPQRGRDPWGLDYNCSDRDWSSGACERDWENRCPDRNGDGWCDYSSRDRYGRLPEMSWGTAFARGHVLHDLRLWLPSPHLEVRFRDHDRNGLPEEVLWVDGAGRAVQSWADYNRDGRADRVVLFRNGHPWRTLE